MPDIAEQLGGVGAVSWFVRNMPRYEAALKHLGPLRTHLVCAGISLSNGCGYCVFGHGYALVLHFFKERGALFPLDETSLVAMCKDELGVRRTALERAAEEAGLESELSSLRRAFALQDGTLTPADDDDRRLAHLVQMFSVLNACGIHFDTRPDEAHDPINKDRDLKRRYRDASAAARGAQD